MSNDLKNLRISQEDLKELTGLTIENFFDDEKLLSAKVVRPSWARNTKAKEKLYKEKCTMKATGMGCLFSLLPGLVIFTVNSGARFVLFWVFFLSVQPHSNKKPQNYPRPSSIWPELVAISFQ